jgi:hypothetical protein
MKNALEFKQRTDHFVTYIDTSKLTEKHHGLHQIVIELSDNGPRPKYSREFTLDININFVSASGISTPNPKENEEKNVKEEASTTISKEDL